MERKRQIFLNNKRANNSRKNTRGGEQMTRDEAEKIFRKRSQETRRLAEASAIPMAKKYYDGLSVAYETAAGFIKQITTLW